MKSADGRDAEHIFYGSTLANDRHAGRGFDYLIANPPYGKDWKMDAAAVRAEHERGASGRFAPGLPRISDGQLLFLLHMLAHMNDPARGGSRMAIIMNGSPLFTGDAGSGESEIRRYVLENDLLEALIALPEQLFYNTGIATYVWVLTNRKAPERRGRVLLVDATSFWRPMRKSLGSKRREIPLERAQEIMGLLADYAEGEHVKIFPTEHFGFRKITVERPLRLNFQASPERIARLADERAFANLAVSRKKNKEAKRLEEEAGRAQQQSIRALLQALPGDLYSSRPAFEKLLNKAARARGLKLSAPLKRAVLSALSEQDEQAEICRDKKGNPEPDSSLRDTENVPLGEDVHAFFAREVLPHVPEAWIDTDRRDPRDGEVGLVGYEINFNRYFYQYTPPRPLAEIEADIRAVEEQIMRLLETRFLEETGFLGDGGAAGEGS
jgi:type I restriction enzyme M protein